MRLCVFDLDGTLINSIEDIAAAMNETLCFFGYQPYEAEAYYHMVGDGMRILSMRAVQNNPVQGRCGVEKIEERYKQIYLKNCCRHTKLYPGVLECLQKLQRRGVLLGIISNKPQAQAERIVSALFPQKLFSFIQGQQEGLKIKPDPESLNLWINRLGLQKKDVVFIGDSDVDIFMGKNAGVETIGVEWGFRGREELLRAGADYTAETAGDLYHNLIRR